MAQKKVRLQDDGEGLPPTSLPYARSTASRTSNIQTPCTSSRCCGDTTATRVTRPVPGARASRMEQRVTRFTDRLASGNFSGRSSASDHQGSRQVSALFRDYNPSMNASSSQDGTDEDVEEAALLQRLDLFEARKAFKARIALINGDTNTDVSSSEDGTGEAVDDVPAWFDELDAREDPIDDDTDASSIEDGTDEEMDEAAEAQDAEDVPDDPWRPRGHREEDDKNFFESNSFELTDLIAGRGRVRLKELKRPEELEGYTGELLKEEISKELAECTLTADGSQPAAGDEDHTMEDDDGSSSSDEDSSIDDDDSSPAIDEGSSEEKDCFKDDNMSSCASVDYPSMDSTRWVHVGDCARLLPESIQLIREFFEGRRGVVTRAQFAGAYTVEVTTPDQDQHSSIMTLVQFRAPDVNGTDQWQAAGPSLAVFGRFVPERCDMGKWVPSDSSGADAGHTPLRYKVLPSLSSRWPRPKLFRGWREHKELNAIFEPTWPWTPHNHELSEMSVLIRPDLSGIACRCLLHSMRRSIDTMGIVLDAFDRKKIMTAMKFSFAFDYVPKMISSGYSPQFPEVLLSRTINMFNHLQWDEEHFRVN
ncbi:hypothetical protein B0T17DRAFT_602812 [Bombardia bombarda]|uniref:Uncharacterized protein n=1 Tax=Bombardia bombarda TaxID=252184 RepID=A0AA39W4S8_9PEZI|nr:hypothetical protein B0T17DRAFT_602812 [Bombardia bombarda]